MVKNGHRNGKQSYICVGRGGTNEKRIVCYSTNSPSAQVRKQDGSMEAPRKVLRFRRKLTKQRFLITAAQNATPVHAGFLKSLEVACEHLNAELLVIPLRYKNPTSRWTTSQSNDEVWAPELAPYLFNQRKALNKHLVVLGDIKTQPTAMQPLTGFDAITAGESGILGHTKLQLRSIPTPSQRMPKLLTTTGACTVANYTDSKAGRLGEFHHTLGACLVEIDGKRFHMRQINADKKDGSFFDLDKAYNPSYAPGKVYEGSSPTLVMGDTHVDAIDPHVKDATFGSRGIIRSLGIRRTVWHDVLDGYAVNPHHVGNILHAIAKERGDRRDIRAEVERAVRFVIENTAPEGQSIVVASNHDDFLKRWIVNTDWRTDPVNASFYLEAAAALVASTRHGPGGLEATSPFAHFLRTAARESGKDVKVLDSDESELVNGIEVGMHGDKGPNGSRGSIRNLRRIGVRSVIGHSHTPGIEEGCYSVGTSTRLKLEYTSGPSSWLNTHCLIYPNGKRTLLNIIDGEWRLNP